MCSITLSWNLIYCAGKPSDVMCVPPWRIATSGGKELAVTGSIKSGAWHPKWRLAVSAGFLGKAYLKRNRIFCEIAEACASFSGKVRILYT